MEYTPAGGVADGILVGQEIEPPPISGGGYSKLFRLSQGFVFLDFLSLGARPEPDRCTSGSADAAKLSPCPTCLPALPSRYALAVGAQSGGLFASRSRSSPLFCGRVHKHYLLSFAFPCFADSANSLVMKDRVEVCPLSRGMLSGRRGLPSIPIPPITGRLSLFPHSCARQPTSLPYGSPASYEAE